MTLAITTLRGRLVGLFVAIAIALITAEATLFDHFRKEMRDASARVAYDVGQRMVTSLDGRTIPATPLTPAYPATRPHAVPGNGGGSVRVRSELVKKISVDDPRANWAVEMAVDAESRPPIATTPALPIRPTAAVRSIPIALDELDRVGERFANATLAGSAVILGLGLIVATFSLTRLTRPLRRLAEGAERLGRGETGFVIAAEGTAEVRATTDAFNRMFTRLAELEEKDRLAGETRHLAEIADIGRGIAHSLRNPLHAIGLALGELGAVGAAQSPEWIGAARANLARMDRTITTFLNLSGSPGAAIAVVDLSDVLDDVALELLQTGDHGVTIDVAVTPERPRVRGVPGEIRTLVHTLVTNAVEASPRGAVVHLRAEAVADGSVRILVCDRGPGLPDDVRRALFRPHVTTKDKGLGLGLFLAQRIAVTCYKGSLALEPRTGGGLTTTLVLCDRRTDDDGSL